MHNAGMIYGYARVSTDAQDLTSQRAQLTAAGCEKVFSEKITARPPTDRSLKTDGRTRSVLTMVAVRPPAA